MKPLPDEIKDQILDEYDEYGPTLNKTELAKRLGVHRATIRKVINKFRKGSIIQSTIKKGDISAGTLNEFRSKYDDGYIIPKKIEEGIDKCLVINDEPGYMEDKDFRIKCGVSIGKWRRYAEEYKHLQVRKDGVIIWGHPDIIDKMREIINGWR